MSLASVRSALESALDGMSPSLATVWENHPYTPVAGTPYQRAFLLPAEPDNIEIGPGYTERGIFQVSLFYPLDAGSGAITARAEAIRDTFPFAASLTSGSVTVNIIATPEIGPARTEDDRFMVPVRIRWHARIAGG